ncbi:NAD-dependent deacetylase [Gemmobacter aquatilis]|uniref:NAD-dependent protein deacylase n=1 Tax=Gemmobacter aquatilis TaxID=933059 RepID=A0A1H8E944_9RHOB|nr:NAD-dependent deacylase [Gemmobacter aquatilis]SEN15298.1 NAD-dependent deacetylase [Gemmobacter aquatilis]
MERLVILTGAGISAESGLGTFRDKDGLWTRHDLSEVATPEGFSRNPKRVLDFYNARRANSRAAAPNPAHEALVRLEQSYLGEMLIVTQNVDDLHERAGSRNVLHMHGTLEGALCAACGHRWPAPAIQRPQDPCPACTTAQARPDIVWFGEYPYHMEDIWQALRRADAFVAIGTSGTVYPAAAFAQDAGRAGAFCLELNAEASAVAPDFDEVRLGPASRIVPDWVAEVLARGRVL